MAMVSMLHKPIGDGLLHTAGGVLFKLGCALSTLNGRLRKYHMLNPRNGSGRAKS